MYKHETVDISWNDMQLYYILRKMNTFTYGHLFNIPICKYLQQTTSFLEAFHCLDGLIANNVPFTLTHDLLHFPLTRQGSKNKGRRYCYSDTNVREETDTESETHETTTKLPQLLLL